MFNKDEMLKDARKTLKLSLENGKVTAIINEQWIIQAGAKTVGSTWNHLVERDEAILEITNTPAQFTKREAKRLQKECIITDSNGDRVKPNLVHYIDFYKKQAENCENIIKYLGDAK